MIAADGGADGGHDDVAGVPPAAGGDADPGSLTLRELDAGGFAGPSPDMADAPALVSTLTGDFPPATEADWRALVDKTLGETPFASLEKTTAEGLPPLREAAVLRSSNCSRQ